MVCPTCFCSTVEDRSNLKGTETTRTRVWDSCFAPEYAHVHGGNTRPSIRARYRQFLTHKMASWFDQFGSAGCVGCGRCMTWCPAGIDPTEVMKNIRVQVTK
jgi:formate hydrogenlyase subunit 6/NADH:ubiquinone oxidoreductase subunit I